MGKDPYKYFRIEGRELVDGMTKEAAALEPGGAAEAGLARVLRMAHTLKGAARVVRCAPIAELAHAVEERLEPHRRTAAPFPASARDELLRMLDAIRGQLAELEPASAPGTPVATEADQLVRVELSDVESILEAAQQASVQLAALPRALTGLREVRGMLERRADPQLAREVLIVLDRTEQACVTGLDRARRDVARMRADVARLRLVEAGTLAAPLEAAARDAARALGKQFTLRVVGASTRLDAHVLSALRDALLHAVRNAVVHGLESGPERAAAGKPHAGSISVRFERVGQRVRVTCDDDGRGIDPAAVRQAAIARGVLPANAALDRAAALELLLEKPVSTSASVTELAGRGVGMDVVRDVARRLKGSVSLRSEQGLGMSVTLLVPVSLFSVPVVVARVGSRQIAIPQEAVVRIEACGAERLVRSSAGLSLVLDGEPVPFIALAAALRWSQPAGDPRGGCALILRVDAATIALGVDRAVEMTELIVVPLPDSLAAMPLVSGVSFDAEGTPELVLDPRGLVDAAHRTAPAEVVPAPATRLPVLVIDDSLTTRMLESSILEAAGYEVDLATSGEEGLEMAGRRRYGAYLVDVEMPGMDGFEFIQRTRKDPALREVPAVLVSSLGSAAHKNRGAEVGARAYVVKSEFEQERFLRTIGELMGSGASR